MISLQQLAPYAFIIFVMVALQKVLVQPHPYLCSFQGAWSLLLLKFVLVSLLEKNLSLKRGSKTVAIVSIVFVFMFLQPELGTNSYFNL